MRFHLYPWPVLKMLVCRLLSKSDSSLEHHSKLDAALFLEPVYKVGDPFAKSGAEPLKKRSGDSLFETSGIPSFSKDIFAKPKVGGSGLAAANRKADQDAQTANEAAFEEAHPEEDKVMDPAPSQKPKAKLANGKWLEPKGKYGQVIEASRDVPLKSALFSRQFYFCRIRKPGCRKKRGRNRFGYLPNRPTAPSLGPDVPRVDRVRASTGRRSSCTGAPTARPLMNGLLGSQCGDRDRWRHFAGSRPADACPLESHCERLRAGAGDPGIVDERRRVGRGVDLAMAHEAGVNARSGLGPKADGNLGFGPMW